MGVTNFFTKPWISWMFWNLFIHSIADSIFYLNSHIFVAYVGG
jgi:hypothetical protein